MYLKNGFVFVDCGPLPEADSDTVQHIMVEQSNQSTVYGSVAVFQCTEGFEVHTGVNTQSIECTETGQWQSLSPCTIKGKFLVLNLLGTQRFYIQNWL